MAKNDFVTRMNNAVQGYVQATCDIYSQYVGDMALITLHDEFGFGEERLKRFWDALQENTVAFDNALGARTKAEALSGETEFLRDRLDEKLKEAMGKYYTVDFEARYPNVEKVRYKR